MSKLGPMTRTCFKVDASVTTFILKGLNRNPDDVTVYPDHRVNL